jgi:pimeloyl-ACP methyl ester carboxylesterase
MTPRIRSTDGRVRLAYAEQGSGLPVVFLHGFTDSRRSFEGVFHQLPGNLRAIAISQRGHGASEQPAMGYRASDFAGDLAAFMDSLGIGHAVLVGHSMGSQVAQRFAIEYPHRALGLVLIGAYPTMRNNAAVRDLWDSSVSTLTDPVDPNFVASFQLSTLARPVSAEWLDMVVKESLRVPAAVWREACAGFLEDDTTDELEQIMAETLILWGERDVICSRADQAVLAAGIKRSRLKVYSGGGHGLHWEEPARIAAEIVAFTQDRALAAA